MTEAWMFEKAHFPEVSTDAISDPPIHQASCECGWKGRRRRDWGKAADEADRHAGVAPDPSSYLPTGPWVDLDDQEGGQ